jgi:hypothetical protein
VVKLLLGLVTRASCCEAEIREWMSSEIGIGLAFL